MELFISAVAITFGILLALFIAKVSLQILIVTLEVLTKTVEQKRRKEIRKIQIARTKERHDTVKKEVKEILESNTEVADLAKEIANTPYASGRTKAARANNSKRAKLQKELRDLVSSKAHRDCIYEMSI